MNGTDPQGAIERSRASFFEGVGHFEAGRFEPALQCFERCQALTPGRPSVLGNLGITLCRLGRTREALPLLQQATAGEPAFTDAWAALGLAHEAHGDWAAAEPALAQALQPASAERPAARNTAELWHARGHCLMRLGRHREALAALDSALALQPGDAAVWSLRGHLLREQGRREAAAQSYERALAAGADPALHGYYLAALRGAGASPPPHAPRRYVQALFDDYAGEFQGHLVEQLGYRGHDELLRPLLAPGRRFADAIDLGCGTGLCGRVLAPHCDAIDGVDLSAAMLAQARQLGVYRTLVHAELIEHLAACAAEGTRYELALAADVLIYVGAVDDLFPAVARVLRPGGLFAFTAEPADPGLELQLRPSLRYAHSPAYVQRVAAGCGMTVQSQREAPIRHEQGQPVAGWYVTLRKG